MKTRPLALIAKVLGRKYDVTVTIAGQVACTCGKEITIPVVSGPHAEALAHGYIDHEAAHVRYTDFPYVSRTISRGICSTSWRI